jgi:hypothetical protein
MEYVQHMQPKETGIYRSQPGFRCMHDAIHHVMWAEVLNCWRVEAEKLGYVSLQAYASSKLNWESIKMLSNKIVQTYLPGPHFDDVQDGSTGEGMHATRMQPCTNSMGSFTWNSVMQ